MGQSASVPAQLPELSQPPTKTTPKGSGNGSANAESAASVADYTSALPDECLALIFLSLSAGNRNRCSLVCKRWLMVDARSRRHLSLDAKPDLTSHIPAIFSRFDSVTNLILSCDRESPSINDDDLLSVSVSCPNLACLELIGCRKVSDLGIASLARNCKNLIKLSSSSCSFGSKGLNAVFEHCCLLEELCINAFPDGNSESAEPIGSSKSLKSICLEKLENGELFGPLIIGATNLTKLELISCEGDWDMVLESMVNSNDRLVVIHLKSLSQVSDAALSSISKCASLETLHVWNLPNCTNLGIVSVAEKCKHLRRVFICCRGPDKIGDEGLAALGRNCNNLRELLLVGANPTIVSLEAIASSCRNLETLALALCESIHDSELSFLAGKCKALRVLIINSCPISDVGLTALFWGFPNLEYVYFDCVEVSRDILHWLKMQRELVFIKLDSAEIKLVKASTSSSDGARPQGSIWNVMLLWYSLRMTPHKQQSLLRSKFGSLAGRSGLRLLL